MVETKNQTHRINPKSSCFTSCFGFSGKVLEPGDKNSGEIIRPGGRRMLRWFYRSSFRMKKSVTKTVPVDALVVVMDSNQISGKPETPPAKNRKSDRISAVKAVVPDQSVNKKPRKANHSSLQNTIPESPKQFDALTSGKDDTCHKQLTVSQKMESKRTGSSQQPGSPENNPKACETTMVSPSSPSPPPNRTKPAHPAGHSRVAGKKPDLEKVTVAGKFDSVVGMSILLVTMAIMLLWGRLCAIVCTSAWFYFIPRFTTLVKPNVITGNEVGFSINPDFSSEEYKKKVILEGFLERKHRNNARIS